MDAVLTILWQKDHAGMYSGMISTCREVLPTHATWDGSQYIPSSPIGNPNVILVYVTGVPVQDVRSLQYVLEENPTDEALLIRKWLLDENLVSAAERTQVLAFRYITVTWTRFKDLCVSLLNVHLSDSDLLTGLYES